MYNDINNGVYKCGFASSQEAYDLAAIKLFDSLDKVETMLEGNKLYLVGDQLSLVDIRLFMTLIRFDPAYHIYFKCSKRTIQSYPNLNRYVRNLYNKEGLSQTFKLEHIRDGYGKNPNTNPSRIVCLCPDPWWEQAL